ncbi:hypothetical protein FRAHR75_1890001 [Frankia sp. Hr75.2]|nr:hypothetical protein FRAHR75_1890001 [Frankia sp. Hr75.2]
MSDPRDDGTVRVRGDPDGVHLSMPDMAQLRKEPI